MKMKFILLIVLFAGTSILVEAQTKGQPDQSRSSTAQQLIKLNQELIDALASGDKSVADRIYAKEFVRVSVEGELLTKAQVLAALKVPQPGFKTVYESLNFQFFDYGETAVLTYLSIRHREINGQKIPDFYYRVADTFIKRDGQWQKILSTGTPIPAKN
jgi:hypothetical protein